MDNFYFKVKRELKKRVKYFIFQYLRVLKYKILSDCKRVIGTPKYNQPTQLLGLGKIEFASNVKLGVNPSPNLYNGYGYIDARGENSTISIGESVWVNNNVVIISEGKGIEIGSKTLIGSGVEIIDSDFHELHPKRRLNGIPKTKKIVIEKNVFIGSNVKILKGVTIGENSIIANSSVVTKSIPQNMIAGGNPCREIKSLDFN
jgi:maltose O-acetyltransferase